MAAPGIPISIGSVEDPLFGPIVSFGMAGAPSELLGDVAYRIPPLTDDDVADLVRDVRAAPLFFGYRGLGGDRRARGGGPDPPARPAQGRPARGRSRSTSSLVLAGAEGAKVLRASGRVAPRGGRARDWFTRRMTGPTSVDDTLIGHPPRSQVTPPRLLCTASPVATPPGLHGFLRRLVQGCGMRESACRPGRRPVRDLRAAIDRVGYYPAVVADAVEAALAGEEVASFVIHHETTFDRDEVRRHVTVLVLTAESRWSSHTDEHPPDDLLPAAVRRRRRPRPSRCPGRRVVVTRMVADPDRRPSAGSAARGGRADRRLGRRQPGRPRAGRRAATPTATPTTATPARWPDDIVAARSAPAAEGQEAVASLLDFAGALSAATVTRP